MFIAESVLFRAARLLYDTEIAHSEEMKASLQDADKHDAFRREQVDTVIRALGAYDIDVAGKRILDFGCNHGALSAEYVRLGASHVTGVDIDAAAIARARSVNQVGVNGTLRFLQSEVDSLPLETEDFDAAFSYDVFEHVARPGPILSELHRVLRPGGKLLIGTWGWRHPFAPHLWAVMPVPWAHVLVSERTLLRVCRRVYQSDWYRPDMHDFDVDGRRIPNKYTHESIPTDYLNKFLIRDFEETFRDAGFDCDTHLVPFGSRLAGWSRVFLGNRWLREFVTGYAWFVLTKRS